LPDEGGGLAEETGTIFADEGAPLIYDLGGATEDFRSDFGEEGASLAEDLTETGVTFAEE
jgi:hypothetical protein